MWSRCGLVVLSVIAWRTATAQETSHATRQTAIPPMVATANPVIEGRPTSPTDPTNTADIDTSIYGAPMLYELRMAHFASVTLKVYDSRHDVLIPFNQFCHLAELSYTIDVPHRIAHLGVWTVHLAPTEFATVHDTSYVSLSALDRVTHATAEIDRDEASITLSNIGTFPVARRANRAALREELIRDADLAHRDTADALVQTTGERWGGLSLDYSLLNNNAWTTSAQGYSLAATTMVAGGALVARAEGLDAGAPQGGASWLGVWPTGHAVAQLRVGDGTASGLGATWSRGLFISNAPLVRQPTVAVIPLDGTLPADWSIEAYRDGALVAFDSVGPTGRYKLPVPVQYGDNPFDLIAYGPSGETQQLAYVFHALPTLLPSNAFDYAASTGACLSASCAWSSNADVQYGVTARWSLRGGVTQYLWRDNTSSLLPYVGMTAMPRPGLGVELETMDASYHSASVRFDPSPSVSIASDYSVYADTRAGMTNAGGSVRNEFSLYGSIASGHNHPELEVQTLRTVTQFGLQGFERIASSLNIAGSTFRPYVRIVQSAQGSQSFLGTDAMLMPAAWGLHAANAWLLRGTLETTPHGSWSEMQVILSRVGTRRFHIEGGTLWQRQFPQPQFTLALSADFGTLRSLTTATAAGSAGTTLQQSTSGSLRWDETLHQFVHSADPVLDRSGVSGVVFLDANGNGQFDPGERPLANVRVRIDNTIVTTDEHGHYEVLGVIPTEAAAVSIDTTSLESPWWTPTFNKARVQTLPNRVVPANVPVVVTGIVEGHAVTNTGDPLQVTLVLTNLTTGTRRTIDTFADGGFYQMGLPPGRYTAQIDSTTLTTLHLSTSPTQFLITGGSITHNVQMVARTQDETPSSVVDSSNIPSLHTTPNP